MTMWIKNFCKTAFNVNPNAIVLYFLYQSSVVTVAFGSMKLCMAQYQNKCLAPNHPFFYLFYLNACVLFIDIIIWFIPSLFTGFFSASLQISVINFNHFLFTCTGIFMRFFRGQFIKQCSQHFFLGFFTGVFIGSLLKLWS